MPELNAKEMAVMLYKLTAENNAMLKQQLIYQIETMKLLRVIDSKLGYGFELSDEYTERIEEAWEDHRKQVADFSQKRLPMLEQITLAKVKEWASRAAVTGDLSGLSTDWEEWAEVAKA